MTEPKPTTNAAPVRSEEPLSAEQFWDILWGEEAFPLKEWATGYASVECPITPSRFNEALQRLNAALASRASSEPRWILASHEMPTEGEVVVAWNAAWEAKPVLARRIKGEWSGFYHEDLAGPLPEDDPTHWMPLPETP